MHNKDKHRLFQKYIKYNCNENSSARDLATLLNTTNLTPKRAKILVNELTWNWFYSWACKDYKGFILEEANKPGLFTRILERAEAQEWANDLAYRTGFQWHKIEKDYKMEIE